MEDRGFRIVVLIVQVFVVSMLLGCVPSADERYDAGFSDGDWSYEIYSLSCQEGWL